MPTKSEKPKSKPKPAPQRRRESAILLYLFPHEKAAFTAAADAADQTVSEWMRNHLRAAAEREGKKIQNFKNS